MLLKFNNKQYLRILTASTIAFLVSAVTNNYTNVSIGKRFNKNPDGKAAFATRSFVSTFLSQIVDNFIFVFLAFVVLPNIPAAWCNLFGFKASVGTIPNFCRPDAWAASHPYCFNGGLTKTVEDSAILLNYMAHYNPRDPFSFAHKKRDFTKRFTCRNANYRT